MSSIRRHRRDGGRRHVPATIWTVLVALATAVTLLVVVAIVFLAATSPNWLGR